MIVNRRAARTMAAPVFYAFTAGQFRGYRDAWLAEVRRDDHPELRPMKVAFAKSAHRAYMNALRLSRKHQAAQA